MKTFLMRWKPVGESVGVKILIGRLYSWPTSFEASIQSAICFRYVEINPSLIQVVRKLNGHCLFLQLGLPRKLIRHDNGAFRICSSNWTGGIWKRQQLVFVWTKNILKIELFESDYVTIITWFSGSSFQSSVFRVKPLFSNFSRVVRKIHMQRTP